MLLPLIHTVLVKPTLVEEADDTIRRAKAAGIHIELDKREKKAVEQGTVVAIGDTAFKAFEAKLLPVPGDKVYFAKYAGKEVKDTDGEEYLLLNDEDVLVIIKET
jgi:co-chaperonin GroES (HSP10)